MTRILLPIGIAGALLCAAIAPARAQPDTPYAPGRVIVKFREMPRAGRALAAPVGARVSVERRFRSGAQLVRVEGLSVEDALTYYASDPRVEYAEPDYIVTVDGLDAVIPSDPRFDEQWGVNNTGQTGGVVDADIDAAEAWTIQTGGDVIIGVIDTGIDYTHEDLAANIWVNPGEIPGNRIDDDNNGFVDDVHGWDFVHGDNDPMDDHRHGTHVSGIIAAAGDNRVGVAGVCWRARLMAVKILDSNGQGTMSQAIAGLEYASMMGVRVTNNSWGSPAYSRALDDAMAALSSTNMLVVAAAGNDGQSNELFPHYPSSLEYANIVAVANSDAADALSSTSNYGEESVDLAAPGEAVLSLFPHDEYGMLSGTSMAAPHVTGTVGLIMAEAPLMTAPQIKALLLASVDTVASFDGKILSRGRLNAHRALAALDAVAPGSVRDLRAEETGSNTVTLTWTAGGDDGDVGTAAAYDIRYAGAPIKPWSFDRATRVDGAPAPAPAGTRQSMRVDGLDVKTTYFFAVRVLDERLNVSELSHVVAGRTRGTPEVTFTPGTFEGTALTGARVSRTLRIGNSGKGTVDFTLVPGANGWAEVEPGTGTVGARETMDVTVRLDALGLAGGDYDDIVTLETNDPDRPTTELPVRLSVVSAPHIVVSDDAVDFGAWFVGAAVNREVRVTNRGDRPLTVSGIGVVTAGTDFNVDAEPFTLLPSGERVVTLGFAPQREGAAAAALRIDSDDPDDPSVTVALAGTGLPPPDIRVAPAHLAAGLHTGADSLLSMTVFNDGTSDLVWNLSLDADTTAPDPDAGDDEEAPFRDLTGVRILYDAAHYNLHWFNYNTLFRDLKARGAQVVVSSPPFTREYLDGFDVVWMADAFGPLAPEELPALVAWVRAGGGLLLEGDYDVSIPVFRGILGALLSGIEMSYDDGATGITEAIVPHETTRGVDTMFLSYVKATLPSVRPPAGPLVYDVDGVCNVAWSRSGAGRIIVMADQNFSNNRMGQTGNQVFGNRVMDWLAEGVSWLGVSPSSGVLEPGGAQVVAVHVDAAGLGGAFDARVVVRSNDPETPVVAVPVRLDATPAPDVVVGAPVVTFPPTAVGDTSSLDMWVGNTGTADLEVTGVSTSSPEFRAAPTAFTVAPGDFVTLALTFVPAGEGAHEATLTIESNDPDEGKTTVALAEGEGDTATVAVVVRAMDARSPSTPNDVLAVESDVPARTALLPNVPNPFNPITTISYDLHVAASVRIVIYDVQGRVVRTLARGDVTAAGAHSVRWDGTDDAGRSVATGIYFVRLDAGNIMQTRKMVLLK